MTQLKLQVLPYSTTPDTFPPLELLYLYSVSIFATIVIVIRYFHYFTQ